MIEEPSGPEQTTWLSQIFWKRVRFDIFFYFKQRDKRNAGPAWPQMRVQPVRPFHACWLHAARPRPQCPALIHVPARTSWFLRQLWRRPASLMIRLWQQLRQTKYRQKDFP